MIIFPIFCNIQPALSIMDDKTHNSIYLNKTIKSLLQYQGRRRGWTMKISSIIWRDEAKRYIDW